jgi:hypothetical protein
MNEISIRLNESEMIHLIMGLLNLSNGGTWQRRTLGNSLNINFKGDKREVQKQIYDWLSNPDRKQTFGG